MKMVMILFTILISGCLDMNNIITNIVPLFVIILVHSYGIFMVHDWKREDNENEKK